ncbi:MAG: GNAT family N-acetyltransferase [Rikenellaceae bacterium]
MYIRRAHPIELDRVSELIEGAKAFLAESGSSQWQEGYPNRDSALMDISLGRCWVAMDGEQIVASAAVIFGADSTYRTIEGGEWKSCGESYVVVHRVAVDPMMRGKGVVKWFFGEIEQMARWASYASLRVDTHAQNQPMQRIATSLGYDYCGIIYVEDGTPRLAYEKQLK